jgi:hypothetical protein
MPRTLFLLGLGLLAAALGVSGLAVASASHAPSAAIAPGDSGPNYTVNFTESGLASGTNWSVVVFGGSSDGWSWGWHHTHFATSNTSALNFSLPNGTYFYRVLREPGYTVTNGTGLFNVSGGSPPAIAVAFSAIPRFPVTFQETGLASGTNWTVRVFGFGSEGFFDRGHGGGVESSTSSTITFQLADGTYFYHVKPVNGYDTSGAFGRIFVNGSSPPTIDVTFSPPVNYTVTFNESGLANGTNWTVHIFGLPFGGHGFVHETLTSSNASMTAALPNGTYFFRVEHVDGYQTSGGHFGVLRVDGSSVTVTVNFTAYNGSGIHHHHGWAPGFGDPGVPGAPSLGSLRLIGGGSLARTFGL